MRDLAGKRVVITGANSGIGLETTRVLASRGAAVVAACRSAERAEVVLEPLRRETGNAAITFLSLDLSSLESVRGAASTLLREGTPIDILINNAGIAGFRGETQDGFEMAFGVNHLGHFLFTAMLFPLLQAGTTGRSVHVASKAHYDARKLDWSRVQRTTATFLGVREYEVSKLANVLFAAELARRTHNPNVLSLSLHPGVVASDIWRRIPWPVQGWMKRRMISNEEGAKTSIHCATAAPEVLEDGAYYDESEVKEPSELALREDLAAELWERSEAWVDMKFDPNTAAR